MASMTATNPSRNGHYNPVAEVLSRLDGVSQRGECQWEANCPGHEDTRPSLSIGRGDDGRALIRCQAGCETPHVAYSIGMSVAELFPNRKRPTERDAPDGRIVKTYDYVDADGVLLFQVCRFEPKTFRQRRPDGKGGWTWKVKGVRKVPYRLPEILSADPTADVVIVEGEKDVDRLWKLGFVATCNAGGAGKWTASLSSYLSGRDIFIVPDSDGPRADGTRPGVEHASAVAKSLFGKAASVRLVPADQLVVGQRGHKDTSDFLDAGGTVGRLREIIDAAEEYRPPGSSAGEGGFDAAELSLLFPEGRTDRANAKRFARQHGQDARYCFAWKSWVFWDGRRWKIDTDGEAVRRAGAVVDAMWSEARRECKNEDIALGWAAASASNNRIESMLKLARSLLPITPGKFDQHPHLLNCPNGTVDLRTGELRTHCLEDFLTTLCPTEFDPEATAPTWDRFLRDIFRQDEDLIAWEQRFSGLSVTGETSEHVLVIAAGKGRNGKSTKIETHFHVVGNDYACTGSEDLLIATKERTPRDEIADLFGKRLVVCSETPSGWLNESLAKKLTGDDTMKARRLYENLWSFRPTHKLLVVTNHKPRLKDVDDALRGRIRIVPYEASFISKPDRAMPAKLRAEATGILAWIVRGAVEWYRDGLGTCSAIEASTVTYLREQDVISRFIDACCIENPSNPSERIRAKKFYDELVAWCEDESIRPPSQKKSGKYMSDRYEKQTSNGVWYIGIGLRSEPSEEWNRNQESNYAPKEKEKFPEVPSSLPTPPISGRLNLAEIDA